MNEEEKESIEWLKKLVKINKRDNLDDTFAEILLNLIEKQSKEIEELFQRNKDLEQIEKEHKEENGRLREELEKIEYIKRNFDYCLEQKTKELEKEIKYWREQAEGYQGLAEQIKEDFENRDRWE